MAKTISELRNQSIQVRDASAAGENTATRVGTVLNDIVGHIEDYENTQSSNNSSQDAKIEGVKSSLNAEIARAKTEESNLSTQIGTERTERQAAVSREETARIQADNDEKTARQQADNAEQDARIKADNDEKTARENADITLRTMIQTEVSNRQIAVKQEEIRAKAAEETNTQAIEDENARATAEEERLQGKIDNTNTNVETLEDKVNSNYDHFSDEVARLDTIDIEIKADLEAESVRATAAEEANTTAIEAEKNRAIAAEKAIIFDVSAHNDGAIFESLQALLSSSNLSTLIPISVRHGGMTIRFIQGSEQSSDNKYVQYRLMKNTWSTTKSDWQGVDDEPTVGSDNLVKSGGVTNKLAELESKTNENTSRSKWIQLLEDKGFFLTDEKRNICFSVIKGIVDGLGVGDNLKGKIIDIIKENVDFSNIEESIRNINIALKELSEEITDIPFMNVDNNGLYITDKNGNITWFIKTFVVEQEGTYAIDEDGNIGIQIVKGEIQTSNIKNDIDEKAFVMAKDNSEEIAKLSAKTEASVKSLIKVVNPNAEQKEISITIPPSTTGKDVYDAMVRIGIHYGSKGDEVLDAINGYPAIYDEVYFDGKCEKDFSDIRVFDTNGKMLPIVTQSHGNYEVVPDNRLRRGQNRMMPNAVGMLLKLNEGDNKVYVSVNDGTSWDKISDKSYRSFVGVDNRNNAYLISGTSSDFPSTGNGNVVKIPFINGAYDYSKAKVVCDLGYDNYDYHTTITINGTATNNGVLRLQCSPSNDFVNWYDIEITIGMTANDICNKISQISFKNNENGWIATYNGGNSVELNSNKTLIYIEPELKGNISGISYSINTTKDNATRNTEASNNSFVSYSRNGVDYVFLGQYQENTNANIRRSTDGGETFHTVLDNQKKYEVTGRNAQHIHHIDYDAYHHVLYAGIDHSAIPYGPTVIRSFDNGATWEDVTFTEEESRTNKNARIWLNDRSRDYTPCWFSEDGSFSLGDGETSELGGCTILRIDNSDGVLDRKFECVVDTLQRAMGINSFDDDFIIAALPSGKTNTTNQLIVSTDKGYSWKSVYSHLDPTSTNHVGNGLRYLFHHYPNGGEHHIISTGVVERGSFPSVRIFKGGNHYYAEICVKVGFLPKEGTTLTVKSGYLMEYPQLCIKDRDLIKPYFNILLSEGYGNTISDAKGNVYPIVGKHTWESANISIATTLPVDYPYKKMFGLRLAEGSYVNLGKMNLSKNGGWSVSFWVNFKNIGLAEQNPHYLERSVILKWGNTAIYFTINGICVGDNTNALYRYNYKGLSNDLYVLYCVSFSVENESGTNMPKMSAWCNDYKFNSQQIRGTASKIVMSDPKINDMILGCAEPRRDYYFCNNDDIYIADVRIYDKELTDEDVYKIHNGFGVRYEQNV